MAQVQNFTWDQGADLKVQLIYKEGDTVNSAVPVDLSTGYSVRMDIVLVDPATNAKERLYTFNSDVVDDADWETPGDQPDSLTEGTLGPGSDTEPNINITVPRSITLPPDGEVYQKLIGPNATNIFNYDVFLRNTSANTQVKVLEGTITIRSSYTLWP
jgi:hypothetical protein